MFPIIFLLFCRPFSSYRPFSLLVILNPTLPVILNPVGVKNPLIQSDKPYFPPESALIMPPISKKATPHCHFFGKNTNICSDLYLLYHIKLDKRTPILVYFSKKIRIFFNRVRIAQAKKHFFIHAHRIIPQTAQIFSLENLHLRSFCGIIITYEKNRP